MAAGLYRYAHGHLGGFGGRPPPPDLTKINKDTVAAGNEPGSAAERPINKQKVVVCGAGGEATQGPSHNDWNRCVVGQCYQLAGWNFSERDPKLHLDTGRRVDGIASTTYDAAVDEAVDSTVVCPARRTYVTEAAAADADAADAKRSRRDPPPAARTRSKLQA